jgi:hypothetical protein
MFDGPSKFAGSTPNVRAIRFPETAPPDGAAPAMRRVPEARYWNAESVPFASAYAVRTVFKKFPTSSFSLLPSSARDCAAASTCEDAEPVSAAPRCTAVTLDET